MADHDPLRPPRSPRAIQFVDDPIDLRRSRDSSPVKSTPTPHDPLSRSPMQRDTNDLSSSPSRAEAYSRAGYRASGPGNIYLPPSPYTPLSAGQRTPNEYGSASTSRPARSHTGSSSPSVSVAENQSHARKMSFKRRAPSTNQKQGILQRASMGVFTKRKSSIAHSDLGSNWRLSRRVHPGGDHPAPEDGTFDIDALIAEPPSIPQLLPSAKVDPSSTPIPTVPFIVLCLVCFGEFSSAGVAGPFLFFMIEEFGVGGESDVGFWAGIVAASFFFAQFLTSLMWASIAEKRGRRFVLMASLVGNASTMVLFGTSKNLATAIFIRLFQGFFNGAVGVAKGAIRDITDETNEGRAYALLSFSWGAGSIVGPILGGLLSNPVKSYPGTFGNSQLFTEYPYLLPCMVASSFTAVGAVLSLFIGPDGGPRTGAIHLPEKIDVERAASQMGSMGRSAGQRISGYFGGARSPGESQVSLSNHVANDHADGSLTPGGASTSNKFPRTFSQQVDDDTGGPPSPAETEATIITHGGQTVNDSAFSRVGLSRRQRLMSRTEERQRGILNVGSAYGYERHMSRSSAAPPVAAQRAESFAQNRVGRNSFSSNTQYAPDFEEIGQRPGLSFAQRFLLAQDDSVFTISDLWVAAAINGDEAYEEVFEEDEDENEPFDDQSVIDESNANDSIDELDEDDDDDDDQRALNESSSLMAPRHLPPINFAQRKMSRAGMSEADRSYVSSRPYSVRRSSGTGRIPSLYANTGVEAPLLSPSVHPLSPTLEGAGRTDGAWDPTLAGIPESHSNRNSLAVPAAARRHGGPTSPSPDRRSVAVSVRSGTAGAAPASVPTASLFALLPIAIIAHYSMLAFHSSTFDQIFMAFLVTPEPSGGLGLTASHYAELIAAMAFFQLVFQFVFYPKVGPPQGKLSHLAMLRLGTALYLPCYTLFPLLRGLLHPDTDGFVMTGMIFFAALRWLANICAFTAISVLINALTPPHLTPLANGLAQTTSSAARFLGPLVGGLVWAKGIQGGPNAHAWPFNYHLGFWFTGIVAFIGFLFTWRIK